MRVSFDGGRINERGVAVAIFDYASQARALLGVEPVILHDTSVPPDPAHLVRFSEAFPVHAYQSEAEMQRLVEREKIDTAYFLKTRRRDPRVARSCRTAIHEVFKFFNPHGDAYAYISQSLADAMTGGRTRPCRISSRRPRPALIFAPALGIPVGRLRRWEARAPGEFNVPSRPRD